METKDGLGVCLFFKALIVDGGEGRGLYFFHFFYFHVCKFLGSFTHKGGGKVEYGAFLLKSKFFFVNFFDPL